MHKTWYNSFKNCGGTFLQHFLRRCFTKRAIFSAKKIKNELFMPRKGKHPK
jgi:hypothetical protein